MNTKLEFRTVVRWEQKPDLYAGENCDEVRARWWGYADGDKDGGFDEKIELLPERFPPGAIVTVQIPCCPKCESDWETCRHDERCDFDWDAWRDSKYS